MNKFSMAVFFVAGTLCLPVSTAVAQGLDPAPDLPVSCLRDSSGGVADLTAGRATMFIPELGSVDLFQIECVDRGQPIPVLGGSLGGNIPLVNPGLGVSQFIVPTPGVAGKINFELIWPHHLGPRTHFAAGVAGVYGSTVPGTVGNVGLPGTIATGGLDSHVGGIAYVAIERSVAPLTNLRLQLGGGVADRQLELTSGGVVVAQGGGLVPIVEVGGGIYRQIGRNVDLGLMVFGTYVGGTSVTAGVTPLDLGPRFDARVELGLRVPLLDDTSSMGTLVTGIYSIQNDPGAIGMLENVDL